MDDNRNIYEVFDSIRPDEEQKKELWDRIEACADVYELGEKNSDRTERTKVSAKSTGAISAIVPRIIAVAAALVLIIGGMTMFTSKTNELPSLSGYVYAAESRATGMIPEEILELTGDPAAGRELYVYAPTIYYLDNSRLIFGNGTGLIIYNIQNEKVDAMVDMQAICSGYYNTDTIRTHVIVADDKMIVYNTESSGDAIADASPDELENVTVDYKPWGFYHIFDLSNLSGDGSLLQCIESGSDKSKIEGFIDQGTVYEQEHYIDAWDNIPYIQSSEMDDIIGYGYGTYSEKAYVCKTEDDLLTKNVLVCRNYDEHLYELLSLADKKGAEPVFTTLNLGIDDELISMVKDLNKLPEYHYNGDDAAAGVICEYLASEYADEYFGSQGVCIPSPEIFGQYESNGELLVFGNFWSDTYCKNGNTLIAVAGGEMPACFHLVKDGDSYRIKSIDVAEDGENFSESIRKMTEGYPGMYDKLISAEGQDEQVRKDAINDYVLSNGLGIDYYKDYGWDPVPLN